MKLGRNLCVGHVARMLSVLRYGQDSGGSRRGPEARFCEVSYEPYVP
jgi:hypothetical protein